MRSGVGVIGLLSQPMATNLTAQQASNLTRACLGSICGPDGPTEEQLTILRSIASHFWGLENVNLSPEHAFTPEEAAANITGELLRRRTRELMVLLELCRHPLEAAHEQRVEEYCHALGGDGPGIELARNLVFEGSERALNDFVRRYADVAIDTMEPAMIEISGFDEEAAAARFAEIDAALRAAAPGTLGAEFIAFYERNGFEVGPKSLSLFAHDMGHVIGGYGATAEEEIFLASMLTMLNDSDAHWFQFLGSVMIHEAGLIPEGYVEWDNGPVLADPANVELMVLAMDRGRRTEKDFSTGDHLSMIDWPIEDVRAHYGIPAQ